MTKTIKKDLFYYLGELTIVVLGVFLAFQLNSWNEARKNKLEEQRIIKQLLQDLKNEKFVLTNFKNNIKKDNDHLVSIKYRSEYQNLDSIIFYLNSIFVHYPLNAEYVNLKSSGKLSLITDKSLRHNIVTYYEMNYKIYEEMETYSRKNYYDYIEPFISSEFLNDTTLLADERMVRNKLKDTEFGNLIVSQIITYNALQKYIDIKRLTNIIQIIEDKYNIDNIR